MRECIKPAISSDEKQGRPKPPYVLFAATFLILGNRGLSPNYSQPTYVYAPVAVYEVVNILSLAVVLSSLIVQMAVAPTATAVSAVK